jgi:hypothetical protein
MEDDSFDVNQWAIVGMSNRRYFGKIVEIQQSVNQIIPDVVKLSPVYELITITQSGQGQLLRKTFLFGIDICGFDTSLCLRPQEYSLLKDFNEQDREEYKKLTKNVQNNMQNARLQKLGIVS